MPRAQTAPTSRATKKRPTRNVKPYDRSSPVSGSDGLQEMQGGFDGDSESDVDVKTAKPTKAKTKAKSEYNKLHLVSLIVKVSQLFFHLIINTNFVSISSPDPDLTYSHPSRIGIKFHPQPRKPQLVSSILRKWLTRECRDTWRKTICPALLDNKPWSTAGPGWDQGMKVSAVMEVVSVSRLCLRVSRTDDRLLNLIGRFLGISWVVKLLLVSVTSCSLNQY